MDLMPGMDSAVWLAAHTENALNSVVCPDCGGCHHVSVCSSNTNCKSDSGRHFSVIVDSGACEGFKRKVNALAAMVIAAPNLFELRCH